MLSSDEAWEFREASRLTLSTNISAVAASLSRSLETLRRRARALPDPTRGSRETDVPSSVVREEAVLTRIRLKCREAAWELAASDTAKEAMRYASDCFGFRACLAVAAAACADFARMALEKLAGRTPIATGDIAQSSDAAKRLSRSLLGAWYQDAVKIDLFKKLPTRKEL
eukprot:gnl/TRDRNA2_/TRDRNA2_86908_c0_seq2.p1 gnl/TRDRNA2_/TRDRNA2_86908_c0~~gnl/TRDRNA2_/TRDRNA2_86908_c0_seq2.p1  ORF type:complete len:170 (-),score=25.62 gnl/TRDRNA2_/TRDRNA2_86908_c0_seq2:21-530(-)